MSKEIVKYEPLMEIKQFSWKVFFIKESEMEKLDKLLEEKKFIPIHGERINVSSIEWIYKADKDIWEIELIMIRRWMDRIQKEKVRKLISDRRKEQKEINQIIIDNIIEHVLR